MIIGRESWNGQALRLIEVASIRRFLEEYARPFLFHKDSKVLDFGCGRKPYRDLVNGEYLGIDAKDPKPSGDFDVILCTQVLQYVNFPSVVRWFHERLAQRRGVLIMTYPTTWPEVEPEDHWRFTRAGMEQLLKPEFDVIIHECRATIDMPGFQLALGYGVICRVSAQS